MKTLLTFLISLFYCFGNLSFGQQNQILNSSVSLPIIVSSEDSLAIAFKSLSLARTSGTLKLQLNALKKIGDIYIGLDRERLAFPFYRQGYSLAEELKEYQYCVVFNNALGDTYFELGKLDSSKTFYEENLSLCQKHNDQNGVADCMLRIGKNCLYTANYDQALDYYFESLSIFELFNNTLGVAMVYKDIGLLYIFLGDNLLALSFLEKSFKVFSQVNDNLSKAEIFYRIGVANERLKKYDFALSYFDQAKLIFEQIHNPRKAAYVDRARGRVFFRKADIKGAIQITKKSLEVFENYNYIWGIIEASNDLGVYSMKIGDFTAANNYLFSSLKLSHELGSFQLLKDTYLHLSELYATRTDYRNALSFYRLYQALNDSVLFKQKFARINELHSKIEWAKNERELQRKNELIVKSFEKIKQQKIHIYLFGICIICILLFFGFLLRQYRILEKKGKKFERINAELDLRVKDRTSALRLTQFSIDHSVDSIFWIDWSGRFVYVNNSACINLDYSKEELLDLKIHQIAPELSYEKWNDYWEVVRKEGSLVIETTLRRKTTNKFPVEIILNYIMHEQCEYAFAFVHDISDRRMKEENLRKAKEKAEESDKLKSAFLANMSHEIRTPMNAIIGFSDMLVNRDFSDNERDEFVEIIKSSGDTLLKLIDDIIDISLIEAGQLKTKVTTLNLVGSIAEINKFFQGEKNRLGKGHVDIRFANDKIDESLTIQADQIRFRQVLTNLIGNALKFTDRGFIETGYEIVDARRIRIFVKDTGIGIPKEKMPLVFERFQKLDDENRIYGGTGLGLTISKKLVEQMEGDLIVESEIGKGSVFSFIIPYYSDISSRPVFTTTKLSNQSKYTWTGRTVLIVEDVDSNYKFLEMILRRTGLTLHWAQNGPEALAFCQMYRPDLVLMDIQLPGKSGYLVTQEILDIFPDLPIIAQTAFAFNDEKQKILKAGCVDCVIKPINGDHLYSVIDKYLG